MSHWRCRRGCSVHIKIENSFIASVSDLSLHTHTNDELEIKILKFKSNLRISAATHPHYRPQQLYTEELARWSIDDRLIMPQYVTIRSTLYEYRKKVLPKLPKFRSQLYIEGLWSETLDGENFLLHEDGTDNKILIFGTEKSLTLLCKCSLVLMDGTFRCVPKLFKQLYTLHGDINGKIFPLLYCLLPNLQSLTYQRMLKAIIRIANKLQYNFSPQTIQLDFEIAAIKAITITLPDSTIKGCYFHFAQAVWRNAQKLGLKSFYATNPNIKSWVRKCITLPLIPVEELDEAWLILHSEAPSYSEIPQATALLNYMLETWMNDSTARFNRTMWNHYYTTAHRTTNSLESWHGRLNSDINRSHPNIWNFLVILKKDQQYVSTKFELAVREKLITYTQKSVLKREVKYNTSKHEFQHEVIDLEEFMSEISKLCPAPTSTSASE